MTIFANKRLICSSEFVTFQRVIHHIMREFRPRRCQREWGGLAAMLGVTMHTAEIWILVIHHAMRFGDLGHIRGQVGMTIGAAIRHSLRRPWRNVTGFALPQRIRMGGDAAQLRSLLGIERAR